MSAVEQTALGAVQWRLANRQRAQLYGWFATLYAAEVSEVGIYSLPWGAAQDEIICAGALQHLRECGSAVVHASAEAALAACRAPVTQIVRV